MITLELLKSWGPCADGYKRFCELFPEGADLETAANGLANDGHADWGLWLYEGCRENKLFEEVTVRGFRNTGHRNTGDRNTGHQNTGHRNTGHRNTGHRNTGDRNTGDRNTGDQNTGHRNTGDRNTGHRNTGDRNTGDQNTGHQNTGHRNTGHRNTGDWNTGDWNTGHQNTGDWNTGHWNTGDWNTGDWNTGDQNTGYFNTVTPDSVLVFNSPCQRRAWDAAHKPDFLNFSLTYWVSENEMTDQDKADDPNFYMRGGQLRKKDYKTAFKESWDKADKADRIRVKDLPNFDAKIFFEISGIDVDKP